MPKYRYALKELFEREGLTTAYQVARALGTTDTQAGRLINPDRQLLPLDIVNLLCEKYDWTPGDFYVPVGAVRKKTRKK